MYFILKYLCKCIMMYKYMCTVDLFIYFCLLLLTGLVPEQTRKMEEARKVHDPDVRPLAFQSTHHARMSTPDDCLSISPHPVAKATSLVSMVTTYPPSNARLVTITSFWGFRRLLFSFQR